ncbi:hypothetical protein BDV93DRAFT_548099 [Ceratobasidium sp. AG-I]|nr:hypothetical protein BDV93DRAFT_548099 [Ceratobasidium sp. AG-I]
MTENPGTISKFYTRLGVSLEDNSRNIFPVPDDTQRPLFALVIGINAYKNVTPLHGAHHPSISSPEKDKRIEEKDAIVIYYAGHGSKLDAPEGWEAGGPHIQALVPQNVKETDASGNPVPAIPDRTIAGLLDNLAHEKGNNITVIFDCCHAASGTRIHGEQDLPPIPPNVDHDIPAKDRGTVVSKDFAFQGLRSHVLLAACASNESAYETKGRGDFTTALLNLLITSGADKLTYTGCIQKFPSLAGQRPQCEGSIENASRVFFNAKISGANRMFVTVEREDNVCFLNAGIAQGITVGSKFDIYTDHIDNEKNQRLGSMRVVAVEPLRSTLDWEKKEDPFDLPKLSYGYQTKCGAGQDFPIHFTDKFVQSVQEKDGPEWLKGFTANEQSIVFKEADVNTAQFIVDLDEKGDVVFETTHALSNKNGLKRLPYSVPNTVKDVLVVLRSAALWTWHLERTNPEHPFKEGVEVEFTRVVRDGFDEKFRPHRRAEGANLNVSGVADIVARKNEYYGMKIWNNTPRDLYAYLFYFDASTQAIDPWTVSSMKGSKGEANLTARSSFTIGYGSGGQSPFSFVVEDNQELEVGVLKLFVTTVQGEFSTVKHSSPFVVEKGAYKLIAIRELRVASTWPPRGPRVAYMWLLRGFHTRGFEWLMSHESNTKYRYYQKDHLKGRSAECNVGGKELEEANIAHFVD